MRKLIVECTLKQHSSNSFTLRLDQARPMLVARMPYSDLCQVSHPVVFCIPLNSALCTHWLSQEHVVHNTARL